jgi:hypothetical protein
MITFTVHYSRPDPTIWSAIENKVIIEATDDDIRNLFGPGITSFNIPWPSFIDDSFVTRERIYRGYGVSVTYEILCPDRSWVIDLAEMWKAWPPEYLLAAKLDLSMGDDL